MKYVEISDATFEAWLAMGLALWPHHDREELKAEFRAQLEQDHYATYLGLNAHGQPVAFISLALRQDYVEGAETSPVAYIEGLYVEPAYRKQTVARGLVEIAEKWAKSKGCSELGSDAYLSNQASQAFHRKMGFTVSEPVVHFIKDVSA